MTSGDSNNFVSVTSDCVESAFAQDTESFTEQIECRFLEREKDVADLNLRNLKKILY